MFPPLTKHIVYVAVNITLETNKLDFVNYTQTAPLSVNIAQLLHQNIRVQ